MDALPVAISGTGRMAREVANAIRAANDTTPVSFVDGLMTPGELEGLPLYNDAARCFAETKPAVVVDFTNAAWTPTLADAALDAGVRMVIGTTGMDAAFIDSLERRCREQNLGAVVAANFAIGAVLMMYFARTASRFFDHAEIIELHHDQKVDAPSGTAKTTAELMRAERKAPFVYPRTEKETIPGSRGAEYGGIAIHSVRLPGLMAHQEVLFGGQGQTLSIRHDSTGRDSFMPGVLAAVRAVMKEDHLVLGLDALFGLA
jgi:4-hydroxy-tetrahydrodipicolinate reductase